MREYITTWGENTGVIRDALLKAVEHPKSGYAKGTLVFEVGLFDFRTYDINVISLLKECGTGKVLQFHGIVSKCNYTSKLYLKVLSASPSALPASNFLASLDVEAGWSTFVAIIKELGLSAQASTILNIVLGSGEMQLRLKRAYAAKSMHDNLIGGLVNHITKMLRFASALFIGDPRWLPYKDLICLGIIFHDMGKLKEINETGNYTSNSFVTHAIFGVQLLEQHRASIIEQFDENFYYRLLSIVTQHHGEWGEPARTVCAHVVHLIDLLDARATSIMDSLENSSFITNSDTEEKVFKVDKYTLVL